MPPDQNLLRSQNRATLLELMYRAFSRVAFPLILTALAACGPAGVSDTPTSLATAATTPLQNGAAVTNLSAATGSNRYYALKVPSGATNLTFSLSGGTGNADLYTRYGSAPSTSTYECRPYLASNDESCTVSAPRAGTYYALVRGRTAYSGTKLTARYQVATAATAVDVYVLWGQSNARGRSPLAELPAHLRGPMASVYHWNGSTFAPLEAKVNSNYPQPGLDWGLEMQFGYLLKQNNSGKNIYFVKHSVGGAPLLPTSGTTWNPNVPNSLYAQAKTSLNKALTALRAQGKVPTVKGLVWVQGGADSVAGVAGAYSSRQTELFKGVRALVGNASLPIVDFYVRDEAYDEDDVNAAKTSVAASLGKVRVLEADAFEDIGDDMHFNGAANLAAGRHLFEQFAGRRYPLPTGLPIPSWHLDMSRQENWSLAGLMKVSEARDVSGRNRHFTAPTVADRPALLEGPLGQGLGVLRSAGAQSLVGPSNPFSAGGAYTYFAVVDNFMNPTASAPRVLIGSGEQSGPYLIYPSGSSTLRLRHGLTDMVASRVATGSEPQIVVATYNAAGYNSIRINGVVVGTGSAILPYTNKGTVRIFDSRGAQKSVRIDLASAGAFNEALTKTQAERLEGYLAHRFGIALPALHPYFKTNPR